MSVASSSAGLLLLIGFLTGTPACNSTDSSVSENLFAAHLGKTESETAAKLDAAWKHYFYGNDKTQRVYYPVEKDMAYIWDVGNNDVRSEGMSYGMMIAVQMNKQEEFNRLWKWADAFMRHHSGPYEGFFAWQCDRDGTRLDPGPASDGEEWFATALFFAAHRWGNGEGIFNYEAEANRVLEAMLRPRNDPAGKLTAMWDRESRIIRFVPELKYATVTDPSYHLPAFYELWELWSREKNDFWRNAAEESRKFFKKAAHPETGLMADYTYLDGTPAPIKGHEHFRFDAWRNFSNVALDHAWWGKDPWQVEQSNRVLKFLGSIAGPIPNQMELDGTPLSEGSSSGLYHMAATAALAADNALALPFVERLWNAPYAEGQWRYYDGMLHMLALLQVSGRFQIWHP